MNVKWMFCSVLVLAIGVCPLVLGQSGFQPISEAQDTGGKAQPKPPEKDKDKKTPEKKLTDPAETNIFDNAILPRGDSPLGFNPHMMGDFPGTFARRNITLMGLQTSITSVTVANNNGVPPNTITRINPAVTAPAMQVRTIVVPAGALGPIKIADNASPLPQDRVFFTWNYFDNLRGPQSGAIPTVTTTNVVTNTTFPIRNVSQTTTTTTTTVIPGLPQVTANLNREVFGFEKTFLGGRASIEMRVPFQQQTSNLDGFGSATAGDLTIIGKYAFLHDEETGNVLSGGLAVTAPTAPRVQTFAGDLRTTYLQPWFGYIWNRDLVFIHAFHSLAVPTDPRDVTMMFNDVGVNLWLYRAEQSRLLNFVVPMAEVHVTTPLDHRDANSPITIGDLVVVTTGVHVGLFRNTTISLGVATPITGPRLYNVEAFMQLNVRY